MAPCAAAAAMRIRSDNRKAAAGDGFRCGIGIATGRAVAGRIGTVDQVKVTAFGPVVNLASRLEGIDQSVWSRPSSLMRPPPMPSWPRMRRRSEFAGWHGFARQGSIARGDLRTACRTFR